MDVSVSLSGPLMNTSLIWAQVHPNELSLPTQETNVYKRTPRNSGDQYRSFGEMQYISISFLIAATNYQSNNLMRGWRVWNYSLRECSPSCREGVAAEI